VVTGTHLTWLHITYEEENIANSLNLEVPYFRKTKQLKATNNSLTITIISYFKDWAIWSLPPPRLKLVLPLMAGQFVL
jgi:hypothetical protein